MNTMSGSPAATVSRPSTSVQEAVRKIDGMIAMGELVPGQRLIEADLMERLTASRATVRAALQYLAGDGVVELLPNRGARIRRHDPERLRDIMQVIVGAIMRIAMELFVSRKITPDLRDGLRQRLAAIEGAAELRNVVMLSDSMARYTEFVCEHSGNAYIQELLSKVHLRHYARQFVSQEDLEDLTLAAAEYKDITSHLLAGRAEEAYAVLRGGANRTIIRFEKESDTV